MLHVTIQLQFITDVDVKKLKQVINKVLVSYHADLAALPKTSLSSLANQLYASGLINTEAKDTPSVDGFISEFKASLNFLRKVSQVQDHCKKFLKAFTAVGGAFAAAAVSLRREWKEAVNKELQFNIDI